MRRDGFSRWLDAFTTGIRIGRHTEEIFRVVYEMGSAETVDDARAILRSNADIIYDSVPHVLKQAAAGKAGWWEIVSVLDAVSGTTARIQWIRKRLGPKGKRQRWIMPAQPWFWQEFVDRGDSALCHFHVNSDMSVIAAIVCPTRKGYEPTVAAVQLVDGNNTGWFTECLARYAKSLKTTSIDRAAVGELLGAFGDVMIPAFKTLGLQGKHLILIPQGVTSCLPLHAIYSTRRGSEGPNCLLQQFRSISYAHSVCELQGQSGWFYSNEQFRSKTVTRHLAVLDRSAPDLRWVALEEYRARLAATQGFAVDIVTEPGELPATYESYGFLNWSGHASSSIRSWSDSFLALADRRVTAREILDSWELRSYPRVVLSACETGADLGIDHPIYEYCGLDFAARIAGASEVVSTMWKVRDNVAAITSWYLTDMHYSQPELTTGEQLALLQLAMLTGAWKIAIPSVDQWRKRRRELSNVIGSELLDKTEALWAELRSLPDTAFCGLDDWGAFKCTGFPFECGTGSFFLGTGS